jgi:hypothetical protein
MTGRGEERLDVAESRAEARMNVPQPRPWYAIGLAAASGTHEVKEGRRLAQLCCA